MLASKPKFNNHKEERYIIFVLGDGGWKRYWNKRVIICRWHALRITSYSCENYSLKLCARFIGSKYNKIGLRGAYIGELDHVRQDFSG